MKKSSPQFTPLTLTLPTMNIHSLSTIIFFIFTTRSLLLCSASKPLDTNGDNLVPGSSYYIVSVIRGGGGGGLTLSSYGLSEQCPTTVTQEPSDLNLGLPCTFYPPNPADTMVRLKSSLNIAFWNGTAPCANSTVSTVWQVGGLDAYTGARLVKAGGVTGSPGCATSANWFRLGKGSFKGSYRLQYDPSDVCRTLMGTYTLGIRDAFGKRVLSVSSSGSPLEVVFIKAGAAVDGRRQAY